jgi:AcrR family transcriptional regulator
MPDSKREKESPRRGPQARGERTRRRILGATLALIARQGAGSFTIREVATEAGVSLGVTTYHFPSRAELLKAAFELHLEETDAEGVALGEAHAPALVSNELGLDEMTDAVMAMLSRMVHEERDVFIAGQELTLEMTRDPKLAETVRSALSAHRTVVERLMQAIGSDAPELDAEILSASFEGFGLKWIVHPDDPEFEARLRASVRRLLERFVGARN